MKVRIKNNTVRFRLDQIDVENIKHNGFCEEVSQILDQKLVFSIKNGENKPNNVQLSPFRLETTVPEDSIIPVLDGSQTGITFTLPNQIGRASCRERVCQYV